MTSDIAKAADSGMVLCLYVIPYFPRSRKRYLLPSALYKDKDDSHDQNKDGNRNADLREAEVWIQVKPSNLLSHIAHQSLFHGVLESHRLDCREDAAALVYWRI